MSILRWIVVIEIIGIASWPLCFLLFRRLRDGGMGIARLLGILVLAYAAWFSAGLGLFPNDAASLVAFLLIYILVAVLIYQRNKSEVRRYLRERKRIILFEQIFFLTIFFLAVFIQAYKPDITVAEKEPDMMYLQAMLKSGEVPPQDLWFAGSPVNYYYLGYVVCAALVKLSSVSPEVGFNLAVATIVPLACLAAFSLAYNILGRFGYALLAPLFLIGLGNLDAFVRVVQQGGFFGRNWWYEMFVHGSREVIPGTIHEFPCFSFLLGDLHAHYIFMPFCFLFFSMLFVFFLRHRDVISNFRSREWGIFGFFFALVLGSVAMFNIWDYPNYVFVTLIAALALAWQYGEKHRGRKFVLWIVMLVIVSLILFLPFYVYFRPAAKPAAMKAQFSLVQLVETSKRSPLGAFLIVNGLGCFVLFSFLIGEFLDKLRKKVLRLKSWYFIVLIAVSLAGAVVTQSAVAGITLAFCILAAAIMLSRGITPDRLFILVLGFLCVTLFFGCEIFYLKDFYGEHLQRQNTVFKFYFQAWILLSVIFSAGTLFVVEKLRGIPRLVWKSALAFLIIVSLIYPVLGTYYRCERFRSGRLAPLPYVPTLNGAAYIRQRHPAEYEALQWVKANVPDNEVILEATGKPYSFYGRVATFTGHSTLLGWGNHESLWRDWGWGITGERTRDIKKIFDTRNKEELRNLITKYGIRYVYIGTLEKKEYSAGGLRGFANSFPLVYRNKDVSIYKVTEK
jgi:YYY domain-containing protein